MYSKISVKINAEETTRKENVEDRKCHNVVVERKKGLEKIREEGQMMEETRMKDVRKRYFVVRYCLLFRMHLCLK